ncbi:PPC domain-containing DNA-binding protein [Propionivibrio sp.]|uniref:PPC domain-containing DNA-binding protein n=1 Tax=Propionivibrio sp. TaxID=2212460 RepID=UPI0026397F79|nr:PPC domain-containing DNA-binding protein [Propionivibrio sp.]
MMDSNDKGVWYKEYKQGRRFLVKIRPGESLVESIKQIASKEVIHNAVILSAIGSVKNVHLNDIKSGAKLPITSARLTFHELEGPLELLSLSGNIVPAESGQANCHLHIMASKSSGDVVGGHMQDAEVFATCEIVLVELVLEGIERHLSKSGGTPTIFFAEE